MIAHRDIVSCYLTLDGPRIIFDTSPQIRACYGGKPRLAILPADPSAMQHWGGAVDTRRFVEFCRNVVEMAGPCEICGRRLD